MAQPGVVAVNSDHTPLFNWAINPSLMNLGGAKDRPDPKDVWEHIKAKLDGEEKSISIHYGCPLTTVGYGHNRPDR